MIELSIDLRKDVCKVPENCRNTFSVQRVFKVIFRKHYGGDEKFLFLFFFSSFINVIKVRTRKLWNRTITFRPGPSLYSPLNMKNGNFAVRPISLNTWFIKLPVKLFEEILAPELTLGPFLTLRVRNGPSETNVPCICFETKYLL